MNDIISESAFITFVLLGIASIITIGISEDNRTALCKQRCSSINEEYSVYDFHNGNIICYCKPKLKLNIVNGIVR
jgi:hypothetical protein